MLASAVAPELFEVERAQRIKIALVSRSADLLHAFTESADRCWCLQDRVQLTTDGHVTYLEAVDRALDPGGVERQGLMMRTSRRRFRLTDAFSKKIENHAAALSLHFAFYNFCRPHRWLRTEKTNRITPAMAAGVTKCQWTVEDLLALLPSVHHSGGRPKAC